MSLAFNPTTRWFPPLRPPCFFPDVRLELESRLSSMQQQTSLKDAAARDQMAEWEERLSSAKRREESASQELQELR